MTCGAEDGFGKEQRIGIVVHHGDGGGWLLNPHQS
jgi:hypothetical protein